MDCNGRAVARLPSSVRVYVIIVLLAHAACVCEGSGVRGQGSGVRCSVVPQPSGRGPAGPHLVDASFGGSSDMWIIGLMPV